MTEYDSEIDPAKALFWHNLIEATKNTTKTEILRELKEIKQDAKKSCSLLRTWASMIKFGSKDLRD